MHVRLSTLERVGKTACFLDNSKYIPILDIVAAYSLGVQPAVGFLYASSNEQDVDRGFGGVKDVLQRADVDGIAVLLALDLQAPRLSL